MSEQDLALQQAAFVHALLDRQAQGALLPALRGLPGVRAEDARQRGLSAYRLNAAALAERSLAAVFPRLKALFDEADFAAMAWAFWRWQAPQRGDLAQWGQALPVFLGAQEGVPLAWPALARLEWALHEAESAPDATLDAASLQLLQVLAPARLRLCLRPGLALLSLPAELLDVLGEPLDELDKDSANASSASEASEWPATGGALASHQAVELLVWRQQWRGRWRRLSPGEAALYAASLAGVDLEQALERAFEREPGFDFGACLQQALSDECLAGAAALGLE